MAKSRGRPARRGGKKLGRQNYGETKNSRYSGVEETSFWDRKVAKSALGWMSVLGTLLAILGAFILPPNPKVTITDTRVQSFFDTYVHIENSGLIPMKNTRTFVDVVEYKFGDPQHPNRALNDISDYQPAAYQVSFFGDGYDLPLKEVIDLPAGLTLSARIEIRTTYHWPFLNGWQREKDTEFVGSANRDGTWSWIKPGSAN